MSSRKYTEPTNATGSIISRVVASNRDSENVISYFALGFEVQLYSFVRQEG